MKIVCCSLTSAEDCTSHGTQLFSSILYAAVPSSAQCVSRLRGKINTSFSRASLSATSQHGNCVTKENVSFLWTQTQSRNLIRAKSALRASVGWSHLYQ